MGNDQAGKTVNTPEFRASYVSLYQAKLNTLNNQMEFSVTALFKKGANLKVLEKAAEVAALETWGADKKKWPKDIKSPFRDQADREKDGELPGGHEAGAVFVSFKTREKAGVPSPAVFDQKNNRILASEQDKIYSGCWLSANVTAGAYPKKGAKPGIKPGITFYLNAVQKVRDDEPLSGRPNVEKAFQPIEVDGEDDSAGGMFNSLT